MKIITLRSNGGHCPRCNEKLCIEWDEYGWYTECIMCGYTHDLKNAALMKQNDTEDAPKFISEVTDQGRLPISLVPFEL